MSTTQNCCDSLQYAVDTINELIDRLNKLKEEVFYLANTLNIACFVRDPSNNDLTAAEIIDQRWSR